MIDRKINFIALLLLLVPMYIIGQEPSYAPYGGPFTPHGDLRVLIIYAGFESDCDATSTGNTNKYWPQPLVDGEPNCTTLPQAHDQLFYKEFDQFSKDAKDRTISNYLYQMSGKHPDNPPLRVVADIFPERINIKGRAHSNREVFKAIQEKYPDFDWSRYDRRPNHPNFKFNNDTLAPDHILDYVVVLWRAEGLGGYASLGTDFTFTTRARDFEEQYKVKNGDGFTMERSMAFTAGIKSLFLHELAHTLYNCPHYYGVNGVFGDYFHTSNGWGMLSNDRINTSANAWESWYIGWIELAKEKDLKAFSPGGIFTLKDFVTTGDAMRIELPFSGQRLWLENHAGISHFDDLESWQVDGIGAPVRKLNKGLMAYIENITDNRNEIISPLSHKYANGLKAISATGNHDYVCLGEEENDKRLFNNTVADLLPIRENPTSGHNDVAFIKGNYESEKLYPDMIVHRDYTNSRNEPMRICNVIKQRTSGNEFFQLYKKNGEYTYDGLGLSMAFNRPGQKMGISHNPMIVNHRRYNTCKQRSEVIYLHGLSVEILEVDTLSGEIYLAVKYDDVNIVEAQMLSGHSVLPRSPYTYDLIIEKRVWLTVDKSMTPDRHTKGDSLAGGTFQYPDFVHPSVLEIGENAQVLIKDKGKLIVKEGSTLLIRKGATVHLGPKAEIVIEKGAWLCIEPGAEIRQNGRSGIVMKKGSNIGYNALSPLSGVEHIKDIGRFEK